MAKKIEIIEEKKGILANQKRNFVILANIGHLKWPILVDSINLLKIVRIINMNFSRPAAYRIDCIPKNEEKFFQKINTE